MSQEELRIATNQPRSDSLSPIGRALSKGQPQLNAVQASSDLSNYGEENAVMLGVGGGDPYNPYACGE